MHLVAAIFILLLIAPSSQPLLAQLDGPYVVSPGENPEHTAPTSSAKLCFVTTIRPCYTLPADGPQDSGEEPLFFGLAPKAEHIRSQTGTQPSSSTPTPTVGVDAVSTSLYSH